MKFKWFRGFALIVILSLAVSACGGVQPLNVAPAETGAEATESAPVVDVEVEGDGPTVVAGTLEYTDLFFTMGVAEPVVILEDQGGFVARDRKFIIPVESQVMGQNPAGDYVSVYSVFVP